MKKPVIVLTILLSITTSLLSGVDLSDKEKSIIYTNALEVLRNYETTINQIGEFVVSDIELAKSEAEGFLELFVNRQVLIFNDLDPAHRLSEFYEAETYSSNLILWYPDGMNISLDLSSAKVSEIIDHGEDVYSLDILVSKKISGNYLNQALNTNTESLSFRIAFRVDKKSLSNFRIVGVRNASSSFVINYSQALKEVNAEDFNQDDLNKIYSELKTVLNDYTNYLSLLGDPQELDEDKEFYHESFINLFDTAGTRVYNDISPEPETNLVSVTTYLSNFSLDYPNGINNISINVDSVKIGNIIKTDDDSYYTYVDADKFFSGNFKGKDIFREAFRLKYKITFSAAGKTISNFKISGIDISSVDFYEESSGGERNLLPEFAIKPVSRKGFSISINGSAGQTSINDQDVASLTMENDLHTWSVAPNYGFISGIGISYFFTENIGIKSGLEYNKCSTTFNLNGEFEDNAYSTDVNSDSYYKIVEADFDSLINISFITIPLLINYTSGKPGGIGFYVDAGASFSIPVSSSYNNSGDYKLSGYYPNNPEVLQYLDIEELGFYDRQNISQTGNMEISSLNISLYGSAGVSLPFGYYSTITIGPEIIFGISDILSYKQDYTDIFGKTGNRTGTVIRNLGIKISFVYKL
ncbi:MAG: PorT family protein [Bacteroidales bacterium]|nr:PorT family protein [Bacteroidales bacterium]